MINCDCLIKKEGEYMGIILNDLKTSYLSWLQENISFVNYNNAIEITSPFLDRHNDHLQIYALKSGDKIKLTDDGYIINDLLISGCDIDSTEKRRDIMQSILNGYGVQRSHDNELYVETALEHFPQRKHMLIQAMLTVNDMFMTSSRTVHSIFIEEVEQYLVQHQIRFSEQIDITGKSGFAHKYEFVIPRSQSKPERLIRAINNPNIDRAKTVLFAWSETKGIRRPGTMLYAFLNDVQKPVSTDVISAFKEYDVNPVVWRDRLNYVDELAS